MNWIDALDDVVTHHWAKSGSAFLLSGVRTALERNGINVDISLDGRKMKDALSEDGSSKFRLVRNPENPLVWGLIPANCEIPANAADMFGSQAKSNERAESSSPRFGRGVWAAFAKPLHPDLRRFLELGPPSKMYDISKGAMPPPLGIEVEESFIFNPSGELVSNEDRESKIEISIRSWAEKKNIPIESLTAKSPSYDRGRGGKFKVSDMDFIDFSGLSKEEKSRVLIPLDLLSKLHFGR